MKAHAHACAGGHGEGVEVRQRVAMEDAPTPDTFGRGLRACTRCHLVLGMAQFMEAGCANCVDLRQEEPASYTTDKFTGTYSMVVPSKSWVASYSGVSRKARGVYAVDVVVEPRAPRE